MFCYNVLHFLLPADHSLFINCGGVKTDVDGNQYEEDSQRNAPAHFIASAEKWAFSSTGRFTGESGLPYVVQNSTTMDGSYPEFYQSARVSPVSLRYYGLCLREGSYKVQLHFAEVMFTNDQTFDSLGRRIFNVSIQVSQNYNRALHTALHKI